MKFTLTTITLTLVLLCAKAQTTTYISQPGLIKFAGNWSGTINDTTFQINLKLVKKYVKQSNFYIDVIEGDYIVKKDGKVIQSSMEKQLGLRNGSYVDKKLSENKIKFSFNDLEKSKRGSVGFELINGALNQAKWTLNNTERVLLVGKYDSSFSVPRKLVLTKMQ